MVRGRNTSETPRDEYVDHAVNQVRPAIALCIYRAKEANPQVNLSGIKKLPEVEAVYLVLLYEEAFVQKALAEVNAASSEAVDEDYVKRARWEAQFVTAQTQLSSRTGDLKFINVALALKEALDIGLMKKRDIGDKLDFIEDVKGKISTYIESQVPA